jgi:hypothetical protein
MVAVVGARPRARSTRRDDEVLDGVATRNAHWNDSEHKRRDVRRRRKAMVGE